MSEIQTEGASDGLLGQMIGPDNKDWDIRENDLTPVSPFDSLDVVLFTKDELKKTI